MARRSANELESDPLLLAVLDGGGAVPRAPRDGWRNREPGGSPVVYWAPVWIPLLVLAQVALLGLKPALAESRRLRVAEEAMDVRFERELSRHEELSRTRRAQSDPVYLERERQLLRAKGSPLRDE